MAKPVVLCILDGWGLRDEPFANAPKLAVVPTFNRLWATCPHATLVTHGPDAGLPSGQMGNSEVGHTNIGAGRVVAMDLGQIDLAIEDGSFDRNEAIQAFIGTLKATGGTAHLLGLVSDGGVHATSRTFLRPPAPSPARACRGRPRDHRRARRWPPTRRRVRGELGRGLPEALACATVSGATTPWTATTAGSG
jgi:hypothetical protein